MFIFFVPKGITRAHIAWWIIIPVEGIITVLISSKWRMLSFKDTHMNERLSLLTMIIIGEGVIGVSKTVGYLWPTAYAPAAENIITTISIVVLLVRIRTLQSRRD
jgi:low temperature requirement protein LtrA